MNYVINNNKLIINKNGVYFALTYSQVAELLELLLNFKDEHKLN